MNTKNFVLNDSTERHHIEGIVEHFPIGRVETVLALVIKTKEAVDTGNLVMPSQQKYVLRKLDFIAEEKNDAFNRKWSSIDIVS